MIQYYLLFPNQSKDNINYDRQLVAESGGFRTVYLKHQYKELIEGMSVMSQEEFTELICDPNDIKVFDNKGNEYDLDEFSDHINERFDFVKNDF